MSLAFIVEDENGVDYKSIVFYFKLISWEIYQSNVINKIESLTFYLIDSNDMNNSDL